MQALPYAAAGAVRASVAKGCTAPMLVNVFGISLWRCGCRALCGPRSRGSPRNYRAVGRPRSREGSTETLLGWRAVPVVYPAPVGDCITEHMLSSACPAVTSVATPGAQALPRMGSGSTELSRELCLQLFPAMVLPTTATFCLHKHRVTRDPHILPRARQARRMGAIGAGDAVLLLGDPPAVPAAAHAVGELLPHRYRCSLGCSLGCWLLAPQGIALCHAASRCPLCILWSPSRHPGGGFNSSSCWGGSV